MAASVRGFYEVADWFVDANLTISSVAWQADDVIVVIGMTDEAAIGTLNTPTATGLTFAQQVIGGTGAGSPWVGIWTATAGSADTQNISLTQASNPWMNGACCYVVDGATTSGAATFGVNSTQSAFSLTVSAGDSVFYAVGWWITLTNRVQTTGSGTATERKDAGNSSDYNQYIGEWLDTAAGTFDFGWTSYASITGIQHGGLVLPASATATLVQEGYRWGTDDGSETAHGWEAAQDIDPSALPAETTKLLRVLVEETGGVAVTDGYKLQYKLDTDPVTEWRDVT